MKDLFFRLYLRIFGRQRFYKLNKALAITGLKGLGILNFQSFKLSGEEHTLSYLAKNFTINTIFDVGANEGQFSKICSRMFPEAKIYAFEPHPINFEKLLKSNLNENLLPVNIGFSDKSGELEIYDYAENDGSSHASIYEGNISEINNKTTVKHKIIVDTIDDYINENNIVKIDFLKLDTEGNEFKILDGARKSIQQKKIEIIQFEFGSPNVMSRTFFKDFFNLLSAEYDIFRILPMDFLPIKNYHPLLHETFGYQNYLAVSKNKSGKIRTS